MIPRLEIVRRLANQISLGRPILGSGSGTGITAKLAESGGADLIIIYNSGRYRMAGRGSLAGLMPYGDANAIVVEMASEVLPIVRDTPILAGVCGTDPFRSMPTFLRQLRELGFSGIQNFPTVGLIDGLFRESLEATGMSFEREVELIRLAHEMDLFTSPYVFDAVQARAMVAAGADQIVAHVGLTISGSIGATAALTLDEAIQRVLAIASAARHERDDVFVICHGGPFDEPEVVGAALRRMPGVQGFFGASSIERLPVERAVTRQTQMFKELRLAD
jgi:predicted TIM-barrel enzyme